MVAANKKCPNATVLWACSLLVLWSLPAIGGDPMRIVAPVKFSTESGAALDSEVSAIRPLLETFDAAGYGYAVWVIDELPSEKDAIPEWADSCLAVFPGEVIIALNTDIEQRDRQYFRSVKTLLAHVLPGKESRKKPEPRIHSVMINYTNLFHSPFVAENMPQATARLKATAKAVRSVSPKTFIWLCVSDEPRHEAGLKLSSPLQRMVDGYFVHRPHEWNAAKQSPISKATESLLKNGKPVICAGFRYVSSAPRPALEKDIVENYRWRISEYEKWIEQTGFSGFCREIEPAWDTGPGTDWRLVMSLKDSSNE